MLYTYSPCICQCCHLVWGSHMTYSYICLDSIFRPLMCIPSLDRILVSMMYADPMADNHRKLCKINKFERKSVESYTIHWSNLRFLRPACAITAKVNSNNRAIIGLPVTEKKICSILHNNINIKFEYKLQIKRINSQN